MSTDPRDLARGRQRIADEMERKERRREQQRRYRYGVRMETISPVPEGEYAARFIAFEDFDNNGNGYGPAFKLRWLITEEGQYLNREVSAICSARMTPRSKLAMFAEGFLGEPPSTDDEIYFEDFVDTEGIVTVANYEKTSGETGDKVVGWQCSPPEEEEDGDEEVSIFGRYRERVRAATLAHRGDPIRWDLGDCEQDPPDAFDITEA